MAKRKSQETPPHPERQKEKTQKAWLIAHATRSEAWLDRILAEGFDIHHIDEDHTNNDPSNLLLVETDDHRAILHGEKISVAVNVEKRIEMRRTRLTKGEKAYQLRQLGLAWSEVDAFLQITYSNMYARQFALGNAISWPIPLGRVSWDRLGIISDRVRNNIDAISAILGRKAKPEEVQQWHSIRMGA